MEVLLSLFDAFSSREPVSTSLENAPGANIAASPVASWFETREDALLTMREERLHGGRKTLS
jgi:hypothetical protein